MSTIIKYTIVIIISILMMSCKYDLSFSGIKGDGNVTTTTAANTETMMINENRMVDDRRK